MPQNRTLTTICVALACMCCAGISLHAAESGWKGNAAAGVSFADGNSDVMSVNLELTADRKVDKCETSLGASFVFGETDDVRSEENAKAFAHFSRLLSVSTYLYVNFDIGYDSIAAVDYRIIAGPGLGYNLFKNEVHSMKLEIGASYIDDKLRDGSGAGSFAVRIMQRYERALSETAKLWESVEYLPVLDDVDEFLLNAELGVETTISKQLSLRVLVQNRHDSAPVTGTKENDVSARMALVYSVGS